MNTLSAIRPLTAPLPARPAAAPATRANDPHEVVELTQSLVRVNSSPTNLIPGENQVADLVSDYAQQAGLQVERFETVRGRPMVIVTLPGTKPDLPAVGFVHHSDVVGVEGEWKLGQPFSGDIATDRHGREVLVGRGSIDTKGPAAQILVAMKRLKEAGRTPERTMQLYLFPDEETGGREGAWYLAQNRPELFEKVGYWVVEGAGIMSKEVLAGVGNVSQDAPFLAVAQKYSVPVQMVLKQPSDPEQAIDKTLAALKRLDKYVEDRDFTFLGDKQETGRSFERLGNYIGGFKGWLLKNFWWTDFVENRLGAELSATNRTDLARTDFYLSSNAGGNLSGPNVKPSSATAVVELELPVEDRAQAIELMSKAAGKDFEVEALEDLDNGKPELAVRVTLPQENYKGSNHGSIPDREHDSIDVTNQALERMRKKLWWHGWSDKMEVVDYFTSKSVHPAEPPSHQPVATHVTLDLRLAVDDDRETVLADLRKAMGDDFELQLIGGPEELDAHVRRLSSQSELFGAAEEAIHETYGADTPILFGNTTASNDVRYLMNANPESQALTFVPVLFTENGAHGPDEAVTVESLSSGVDWMTRFMEKIGRE
ncbi:MAG: M20/M25/M40 family metallo-hydrolase [Candidatus Eremiobacteraeota bacterium]|nr:M20/M25/M40 family metallo-hydrolase [Candidatus Eremiobacteraeota bacterium]